MVLRARAEEGLVGMDMCNGVERWLRLLGVSGPQGISDLAYEEEFVLTGDHGQEAVSVTVLPCRFAWGHFGLETALLPLRRRFAQFAFRGTRSVAGDKGAPFHVFTPRGRSMLHFPRI